MTSVCSLRTCVILVDPEIEKRSAFALARYGEMKGGTRIVTPGNAPLEAARNDAAIRVP